GGVQVRLGPKAQPVVHGDDGPLGRGGQSRPDQRLARGGGLDRLHLGGGGLHRRGHMQVGGGGLLLLGRGGVLPPVGQGGVVVGAGIDHAVLGVVVGQILVVPAGEGELQHLHAGEAAVRQQLPDAVAQVAQVLGDDGQFAQ